MRCPHCDAEVPRRARACPECGSDESTGWASAEDQDYAEVDIPDAYDPDRWEEEGAARERKGRLAVWVVAFIVAAFVLAAVGALLR
jgi:hypothetical protein